MMLPPEDQALTKALLDAEWARVHGMLSLAEAVRTGETLSEDFGAEFASLAETVEDAREAGAWAGLTQRYSKEALNQLTRLDLDLMALVLSPVARPAYGPRIQSLQPQQAVAWPGIALVQELLMLNEVGDVDMLFDRLHPTAPAVAMGLIRVEGATPNQTLKPGPQLIRAVLGRDPELAPPPGAHLIEKTGEWGDLVLPETTLRRLNDFSAWVHHARDLEQKWGARPIFGPLALFSGPSGTGKSFAASVIVQDLARRTGERWALYSLDLGRIMSKYVGETEANLNALLDALEGRNALLQIDEADGLLGKRGEVSDARDRYANLEVSHMLARFERHAGPVILTTNLRSNVDTAFLRRFQLIVDFPSPDAKSRAQLWKVLLPKRAPLAKRVDLDLIGDAVRLSGGSIQNAASYATILAAESGGEIDLPHIVQAVWAELNKDSRQVRLAEIGKLAEYLEDAP